MKANETLQLPPVIKSIDVACSPERAFALFTAEIHAWWPLATHSLAGADHAHVEIEPRIGGRVFERDRHGREYLWGTVLAWDPPRSFRFTWRVGQAASSAQEVEVRLEPISADRTRLTLTHSGWVQGEPRDAYESGWTQVLGHLIARAARPRP